MGFPRRQIQYPASRWSSGRPSLTAILIGLNVFCFAGQMLVESIHPGWMDQWFALSFEGVRTGCVWQLLTYMFLHGNVPHLLVNMLTLFFAGREVEGIVGPKHLLGIYFGGGLCGGIAQMLLTPGGSPLVGASAGVCATLIAFTTILPEVQLSVLLFFVIPVRLKAKNLALLLVGTSLLFAVTGWLADVGHVAHLAGCFAGWVYARKLGYGNPLRVQQHFFKSRRREERLNRMPPEQFISEEIDPILDKIAQQGIHSLTSEERQILEKGREKIAQKTARH